MWKQRRGRFRGPTISSHFTKPLQLFVFQLCCLANAEKTLKWSSVSVLNANYRFIHCSSIVVPISILTGSVGLPATTFSRSLANFNGRVYHQTAVKLLLCAYFLPFLQSLLLLKSKDNSVVKMHCTQNFHPVLAKGQFKKLVLLSVTKNSQQTSFVSKHFKCTWSIVWMDK